MENAVSDNKIVYGLRNLHIAKQTETVDEKSGAVTYSYEDPKSVPGAVNMSAEAQGDNTPFYADDIVYYRTIANNGYSGDLELALLPDWMQEEYLGFERDDDGVMFETALSSELPKCVLLFEFQGDVKAVRHALFNVTLSRPTLEGATKEDKVEPKTQKISYSSDPRKDGVVKASTTATTKPEVYDSWYTKVVNPKAKSAAGTTGEAGK